MVVLTNFLEKITNVSTSKNPDTNPISWSAIWEKVGLQKM